MLVFGLKDLFIFTKDNFDVELSKFKQTFSEYETTPIIDSIRIYTNVGLYTKLYVGEEDTNENLPYEIRISEDGALWQWA